MLFKETAHQSIILAATGRFQKLGFVGSLRDNAHQPSPGKSAGEILGATDFMKPRNPDPSVIYFTAYGCLPIRMLPWKTGTTLANFSILKFNRYNLIYLIIFKYLII